MDLKLLFDEFAASMVRERTLMTDERLSAWTAAVKSRLVRLGKRRGYSPFATDDRRKSAAYLWDVAWCIEDKRRRGQPASGAGIEGLAFPEAPYRKLVLTAEVEWGRQGQRPHTQVFRQNLEEVFRDFYKLMDARSGSKVMVYTTWLYPEQAGLSGLFLRGFRQILLDYDSHLPGDRYLFIEFDDRKRMLSGYLTEVPRRGPRPFRIRCVGSVPYPRRWDPNHT
ncbi:MAG TPA: hypothetical protein DIU15_15270 [Deltaproteobacteria bacterium]|nr:hypothetical protein [Deltaproteobacteria bacterium]HCP47401.1 hypothetical protein [Deltaproteobacteria bacterium]